MSTEYIHTFNLNLSPNEFNENIDDIIQLKIDDILKQKHYKFGIINKLIKIKSLCIGKIEFENCNSKVNVETVLDVIKIKNGDIFKCKINETTDNGFYCSPEFTSEVVIFVLKETDSFTKNRKVSEGVILKSGKPDKGFLEIPKEQDSESFLNIQIIKNKFQNNKWLFIGKIVY
jgi:hypothetical protein